MKHIFSHIFLRLSLSFTTSPAMSQLNGGLGLGKYTLDSNARWKYRSAVNERVLARGSSTIQTCKHTKRVAKPNTSGCVYGLHQQHQHQSEYIFFILFKHYFECVSGACGGSKHGEKKTTENQTKETAKSALFSCNAGFFFILFRFTCCFLLLLRLLFIPLFMFAATHSLSHS